MFQQRGGNHECACLPDHWSKCKLLFQCQLATHCLALHLTSLSEWAYSMFGSLRKINSIPRQLNPFTMSTWMSWRRIMDNWWQLKMFHDTPRGHVKLAQLPESLMMCFETLSPLSQGSSNTIWQCEGPTMSKKPCNSIVSAATTSARVSLESPKHSASPGFTLFTRASIVEGFALNSSISRRLMHWQKTWDPSGRVWTALAFGTTAATTPGRTSPNLAFPWLSAATHTYAPMPDRGHLAPQPQHLQLVQPEPPAQPLVQVRQRPQRLPMPRLAFSAAASASAAAWSRALSAAFQAGKVYTLAATMPRGNRPGPGLTL